jgi:hypothetical protein
MLGRAEDQVEEQWRQSVSFFQRNSLRHRDLMLRQALEQAAQGGDEAEIARISGELVRLNQERQRYDETQNS